MKWLERQNIFNILWSSSSLILLLLSKLFDSNGPRYEGGIWYVLFVTLWVAILFLLKKRKVLNIPSSLYKIPYIPFFVGVFILLGSNPLFENDHYRYLWEGKVLVHGFNPYQLPPHSPELNFINFGPRLLIGYPDLTGVYPPLALLWFSLVSPLSFSLSLKVLMLLNAFLVLYFLKLLAAKGASSFHLLLLIPFLQKEFIQGVHIDLLALLLFLLGLWGRMLSNWQRIPLFTLSLYTKILGVFGYAATILNFEGLKRDPFKDTYFIISALSLPLLLWWLTGDHMNESGFLRFAETWLWNPGIVDLIQKIFSLTYLMARLIGLLLFAGTLIVITFLRPKLSSDEFYLVLFSSLMFFSPVFNPWYAIWFLPFALTTKNPYLLCYGIFSAFSYLGHGNRDLVPIGQFLCHGFFPLGLIYLRKMRKMAL